MSATESRDFVSHPGQVTAAYITPDCRSGRGVDGAWDEAVARLREQYDAVLAGWGDRADEITLDLILALRRPK